MRRCSSGVTVRSSVSTKCCVYIAIRKCWCGRMLPDVGMSSPVSSFSSVLLPAPLAPTNAMRLSRSMPKSTFLYSVSPPGYANVKSVICITGGGILPGSVKFMVSVASVWTCTQGGVAGNTGQVSVAPWQG